ncbi:MAG: addiction module protein [Nevskia sp.]|nr:addiction module protein [Nevskia sp.]
MIGLAQRLLHDALRLSLEERASVAAELLASLDEPLEPAAEVEAAWAEEIERRAQQVQAGEASGKPWPELQQELEARLAKK